MGSLNKYPFIFLTFVFLGTFYLEVKSQDYVRVRDSLYTGKYDSLIFIKPNGLGFKAYMGKKALSKVDMKQRLNNFPTSSTELYKYNGYIKAQQVSELLCIGFGIAAIASYDPHHPKSFPGLAAALSGGCLGSMIIMHIQAHRHLSLSVQLYNKEIRK